MRLRQPKQSRVLLSKAENRKERKQVLINSSHPYMPTPDRSDRQTEQRAGKARLDQTFVLHKYIYTSPHRHKPLLRSPATSPPYAHLLPLPLPLPTPSRICTTCLRISSPSLATKNHTHRLSARTHPSPLSHRTQTQPPEAESPRGKKTKIGVFGVCVNE